jgi:hypothetical protein
VAVLAYESVVVDGFALGSVVVVIFAFGSDDLSLLFSDLGSFLTYDNLG